MRPSTLCAVAALSAVMVTGCATAAPSAGTTGPAPAGADAGSAGTGSGAGVAGSTGVGSTGVGSTGAGSTAGSAGTASGAGTASCRQQFRAWQIGPAKLPGEQIGLVAGQVQAAASAQNVPSLTATLRQAGKLAAQLQRYPMPACADPKGYWSSILVHLKAAGDTASRTRALSALMAAAAPLAKIPLALAQLSAELTSTAGT